MLIAGQVLTIVETKPVFLTAIVIFEIGSLICGAANSMPLFLVGRALAGLGGAISAPLLTGYSPASALPEKPPSRTIT